VDDSSEAVFVPTVALGDFNKSVPVYAAADGKHYMVDVQLSYRSNSSIPQVARLIIDTGSGDTVVFGTVHCDNKSEGFNHEARGGRGKSVCFDYRKSQSFKFNVEALGRKINHECRYEEPGHKGAYCKEALLIDGYKAEVMCELAWEDVTFAEENAESAPQHMIRTDICVVNDTETDSYKMRYWNNTQGTLGLFYHLCEPGQGEAKCLTPYPSILSPNSLSETYEYMFTLDLNSPDKPSYMHFGAPAAGWGDMSWSETQPVSLLGRSHSYSSRYAFHSFELFDLRVCGTDLLGNYSSHWTAMIDTGAACLSLPLEFFAMVEAWVPGINCVQEYIDGVDFTECITDELPCPNFKKLTICYLNEGVRASDLPVMSFRLGETENKLYLPLEDLVVSDRPSGKPRVCLNPTDSYAMFRTDQIKDLLYFPKISFGTLALRNLVTVYMFVYTYTSIFIYAYMCIDMDVDVDTDIDVDVHINIDICILDIYINIYIHIYMYVYIYM